LRRAKPLLGTLVEIHIDTAGPAAERALRAAFAEIATIHRLMSFHEAESDVSAINRARPGDTITLDARTRAVLAQALALNRASDGAFNIAVGRELVSRGLLQAPAGTAPYGIDPDASLTPLTLESNRVTKWGDCWIDLGGIAKGYAVDRALEVLARHGIGAILVNAGGDLRHAGPSPIRVHLRDPASPTRLIGPLEIGNRALASSATSGLAPAPRLDAVALLDGRSRRALPTGIGVSVMARTCMMADALTKVVLATRSPNHRLLTRHHAATVLYRGDGAFSG
jgi:thiamine biosynthesis lipoprotein